MITTIVCILIAIVYAYFVILMGRFCGLNSKLEEQLESNDRDNTDQKTD